MTASLFADRSARIEWPTLVPSLKARKLTNSESIKAVKGINYVIDALNSSGKTMSSKNARLVGLSPYLNNVIKRELNDLSPQDRSELKKYLKALGREAKKGRWR